jgi:glycosyltransferase involved in cell wall biosynthesis
MQKETYIWGAGHYGVLTALDCESREVKVNGFIDKNAKAIKVKLGLPVLELNELKKQDSQIIIAIQNEEAIKEIMKILSLHKFKFEISPLLLQPKEYSEICKKEIFDFKILANSTIYDTKSDFTISIIVPVFNQKQFLQRCFNSIINQTYPNDKIECIFVNDCSVDDSLEIIEDFIKNYKGQIKFKIISHEQNRGLGEARNTGIKNSNGHYLFFFDSDDEIYQYALQILAGLTKRYENVDMVVGTTIYIYKEKDGKLYQRLFYDSFMQDFNFPQYTNDRQWIKKRYPFHHTQISNTIGIIPITAWNKLIRKNFIVQNNLYFSQIRSGEDIHWSFYASKVVKDIAFSFQPTYLYHREHGGRIMNDKGQKTVNGRLTLCEDILRNMESQFSKETLGLINFEMQIYVIPYLENNEDADILERTKSLYRELNKNSFKFAILT